MRINRTFVLVMGALVAFAGLAGCSQSRQRKASKGLTEQIEQTRQVYDKLSDALARQHRYLKPDAAVQNARLSKQLLQSLDEWMAVAPARQNILTSEQELKSAIETWARCRIIASQIISSESASDDMPAADLPPALPAGFASAERLEKVRIARIEDVKARMLLMLSDKAQQVKVVGALLDERASVALNAYMQADPTRMNILADAPAAAQAKVAEWACDAEAFKAIVSGVVVAGNESLTNDLREAVGKRLKDSAAVESILDGMRGGLFVAPPVRSSMAVSLQELDQASSTLSKAIAANADAPASTKEQAYRMLGRLARLKAECLVRAAQAARDDAVDSGKLASALIVQAGSELSAVKYYSAMASMSEKDICQKLAGPSAGGQTPSEAVGSGSKASQEAQARVKELQQKITELSQKRDSSAAIASDLGQKASDAYTISRTGGTNEDREKALADFMQLQRQADQADRDASAAEHELRATKLGVSEAQIETEKAKSLIQIGQGAAKELAGWLDAQKGRRVQAVIALRASRKQIEAMIARSAESTLAAEAARSQAEKAVIEAGDFFKKAGRSAAGELAACVMSQGDMMAGRVDLANVNSLLASSLIKLMAQAVPSSPGELADASIASAAQKLQQQWQAGSISDSSDTAACSLEFLNKLVDVIPSNVAELRSQSADAYNQAVKAFEDVASSSDPAVRRAGEDGLATAYASELLVASDRNKVIEEAQTSAIKEYLSAEPSPETSGPRMAIRNLRAILGLIPAAEPQPAQDAPAAPAATSVPATALAGGESTAPAAPAEEPAVPGAPAAPEPAASPAPESPAAPVSPTTPVEPPSAPPGSPESPA